MNDKTDKRAKLLQEWLQQFYSFAQDSFCTVSGDASFRRYFRFIADQAHGQEQLSLIAVDAPPELENNSLFLTIAQLLLRNHLTVPEIYQYSLEQGFFVLTDFGDQLLLHSLNKHTADHLYDLAMQSLINMQKVDTDDLPTYSSELLQNEMSLFSQWYLHKHRNIEMDHSTCRLLDETFLLLKKNALEQPQVFVHCDYHSRNLMVLSHDQLGIIDFQDAVKGPITYDLVSLLRDCYVDWPTEEVTHWAEQFYRALGRQADFSFTQFIRWFDLMGLQRHLKAIGIFCRLNYRDHKKSYLDNIPRTLNYAVKVSEKYEELKPFRRFLFSLL